MITTLNLISTEEAAIIQEITTDHVTKERLESLGLISGVDIVFVRKSPFGTTRIYKCLNTLVALRNDIAEKIRVEVPDESK
ncbi:FeoA family protein [Parasporobacterium paucivorans]|uniref:Ferrous iron transport protein A n=1 Tax=Parasporobacterium paucivorans DSM 15970 TaxID=1122934 RepID=A0A1M6I4N4_9FIRM|nr:FeoA family protein [Parasporobacterium paucivorans]SHJ29360.1 ferrous iron transport protein A [Parasporobacterium paucivorans DSM 15970]